MEIKYSVTIKKDQFEIDMHYGLESFRGVSDVLSIAGESILKERVPQHLTHKNEVRTNLRDTFKGSYGLNFVLEVNEKHLVKKLRRMGKSVFSEVVSYFVYEALHLEYKELSKEANAEILKLDHIHEHLITRLREPLKKMHEVSRVYGHEMVLNYKKPGKAQEIAHLTHNTVLNLTEVRKTDKTEILEVFVNRFNTFTGNGRLVIRDEDESIAFGFGTELNAVRVQLRKVLSKNLHENNGVHESNRSYIKISVQRLLLPTKETVKLIIKGIMSDEN